MQVWAEPFTPLRLPKLFNLRTDPYEFADITSNSYYEWFLYHAYIIYGAWGVADQFAATFKDFPPVQKPNTFTTRWRRWPRPRGPAADPVGRRASRLAVAAAPRRRCPGGRL
jgi:hypothetical protein